MEEKRPLEPFIKHIHCLGIGGVGVCAVAELLLAYGYQVSGSDIKDNANTQRLREKGAQIFIGHRANNIEGVDLVVYSSAIKTDNPEWLEAINQNLLLMQRAEMLSCLMNPKRGIAITGTHGKTTTASLVAYLLLEAGIEPSFAIGGELKKYNQYAHLGRSDYFIAEADESDASFLHLSPQIAVLNNIDRDHMETYDGHFVQLKQTFLDFLKRLPKDGLAILSLDDPHILDLIPQLSCRVLTFGFHTQADIQASQFSQRRLQSFFTLKRCNFDDQELCLNLPGQHNVQNALAAIAIACELGIDASILMHALKTFPGVGRRFHICGQIKINNTQALLVNDYGHHPRAIKATVQAIRKAWPHRRLVLVFQPHRYTRTHDLFADFVKALVQVDLLLLLNVYSAGEAVIEKANAKALCQAITQLEQISPIFVSELKAIPKVLKQVLLQDDIVLLQGAGSIGSMAQELLSI